MFHEYSKTQLDNREYKNTDKCIYEIIRKEYDISHEKLKYYTFGDGEEECDQALLDKSGKFENCYVCFSTNMYEDMEMVYEKSEKYQGNQPGEAESLYIWCGFYITKKE